MASNDLKTWISDKLMVLLGYSQTAVVNYLIAMAKKSKSPTELVGELVNYGFSSSGDTRSFAEEIFARVPRKSAGVNLYQQREAEAAMLVRKQSTYTLLDADDDEDEEVVKEKKPPASESRKSDKGKNRFRKKSELSDDSDEEVPVREDSRHVRRKVSEDEDDDGSESEEERVRDQKEREELEQH